MSKLPKYGKVLVETNFNNGVALPIQYKHYEYRVRVNNTQEEMQEYLRFCEEAVNFLNATFKKESAPKKFRDEGWYYVIKSWTEEVDD